MINDTEDFRTSGLFQAHEGLFENKADERV